MSWLKTSKHSPNVEVVPALLTQLKRSEKEDKTMTLGEYRVGITFNPSNNPLVDKIKRMAADLIDTVSDIKTDGFTGPDRGEIERLKSLAMTHIEDAAMWGVKAATKQKRE